MPDATAPRPNANTYWVVPHKFLAGEYPGDKDPVKARQKIKRFLEVGVRHFVDLTEFGEYEFVPYEAILEESRAANITATYQRFPIRDISVPSDAEYLAEILLAIDRRIRQGGAVYVHCRGGVGRTGCGRVLAARARSNAERTLGRVEREMENGKEELWATGIP